MSTKSPLPTVNQPLNEQQELFFAQERIKRLHQTKSLLSVPVKVENFYTIKVGSKTIEIDSNTGEFISVSNNGKCMEIKWPERNIDNSRKSKLSDTIKNFISNLIS